MKRQDSGTAGRIENCQIGVILAYAGAHGATSLDRALYLPKEWAADPVRRAEAHVPDEVSFQTKLQLAWAMIEAALDAGVPCGWVTGDEVYGNDRTLRVHLKQRQQPFVLAVACTEPLWREGSTYRPARELAAELPPSAWHPLSAGAGAKGPRLYDWAWQPLWRLQVSAEAQAWGHGLLVRRSLEAPHELAYYVVFAPRATSRLDTLVAVAGRRWAIKVGFEAAKQECGRD